MSFRVLFPALRASLRCYTALLSSQMRDRQVQASLDKIKSRIQLVQLILAQLARQENALLLLSETRDAMPLDKKREALKIDAMEVLQTVL